MELGWLVPAYFELISIRARACSHVKSNGHKFKFVIELEINTIQEGIKLRRFKCT